MTCPAETMILIYYDVENFFDLSSIESMYRAELNEDRDGITSLDRHSLTENDRQFFDKLLKRASSAAYVKLQSMGKDIVDSWKYNNIPPLTVSELNDLTEYEENLLYKVTDSGTLTLGSIAVVANDKVYYNGSIWVKDNASETKYIYYYLNLPANYDLNNKEVLNDKIEEYISVWIVKEWFKRQRYSLDLIVPEVEILGLELNKAVNYRKSINRPSRTF